jgi:5-methylcytosine-specific restriction endonuclease McrBC GTP-binding regulatory subunit McrB
MASSKVIILEGISGTGKTSLPYAVSRFFSHPAQMVSVQPNWRDRAELLGYFNEFTKRFNETDFLASLYESSFRDDPCFIVLDEMNLARIEYYFADFLSVMEMPDHNEWLIDLVPNALKNDPVNLIEGKVFVPQNLWFIGTANQDDSTFTITDKVYDRAVTIGLNQKGEYFDAPPEQNLNISNDYLTGLFDKAVKRNAISLNTLNVFEELDEFIQKKFKIAFGNRIMLQIKRFIPIFVECGGSEYEGLDFMLASKILRKFTSLNLPFLVKEINELIKFLNTKFGQGVFKDSIEYLESLLKNM